MRNVGREPLPFKETAPSFIKEGSLCGANGFKFYATPPGGRERLLPCKPSTAEPGSGLELTLLPGEYLVDPKTRAPVMVIRRTFTPDLHTDVSKLDQKEKVQGPQAADDDPPLSLARDGVDRL